MKFKTFYKIISQMITFTLLITLLFMIFVVISSKASGGEPNFLGYQIKAVLSGSMEPTFKTGAIIAVKPTDDKSNLKKGDVITYKQDEQNIVTHRISEVIKSGENTLYETKGDNNDDKDMNPVLSENVIGTYTGFTIPYLGYIVNFAKSKAGTAILLIVPGILLLIYSGLTLMRGIRELEQKGLNTKKESIDKAI